MSSKEIGIEDGRKNLGDYIIAAEQRGEITIVTRYGKPAAAIVPINRIAPEATMTITAADLATEAGTTVEDVLALVDQLTTLDNSEAVVIAGAGDATSLTAQAADTIREQLAGAASYTLSIIEGDAGRDASGQDIEESPISYGDLDDATTTWLEENGYDTDHPARWVLVTPADEDPNAVNVIASRDINI